MEELENKFKNYTKEIYKKVGDNVVKSQTIKKMGEEKKRERCNC